MFLLQISENKTKYCLLSFHCLLKNTSEDTPIPIVINKTSCTFLLRSYFRGHHVYMKVWNATINDSLQCEIEESNEFHPSVVALIHDCLKRKVVGHVPYHSTFHIAF